MTVEEDEKVAAGRRQRIEEAALELFAERGFSGTPTSEIAKRAGVAEGTIFRHFPTKKALLMAVARPVVERLIAPIATRGIRQLLDADYPSLEEFLTRLYDDRIGIGISRPTLLRVVMQEATLHQELRDLVADTFLREVYPSFRDAIDRLKAKGEVALDLETDRVIRLITSTAASYLFFTRVLFPRPNWDDARDREENLRFLVRGLSPPRSN